MSHFTVLVIGENPEKQLAPYDERISMPPYDKGEVEQDEIQNMIEHYVKKGFKFMNNFDELYRMYGKSWNSNGWRKHTDGSWHEYSTYNPNSKWDWHSLGGRWTGYFKLKSKAAGEIGRPGLMTAQAKVGFCDAARKKDVDFEYKRNKAVQNAIKEYKAAMEIIGDLPVNKTWAEIRETEGSNEEKRDAYWSQPRCKAWKENQKNDSPFDWDASPDDYLISEEEFIQKEKDAAGVTYALVKDGVWYGKGEMGWFGMSNDKIPQSDWNKEFSKLIDSVPDDTLLSLYDCHI